jgi:hypothetical protein
MPAEGFLRHRGLIALAVGGAAAEVCLLSIVAPAARPLAPQVTAFPPLAVFHDLRWLFGYNRAGRCRTGTMTPTCRCRRWAT